MDLPEKKDKKRIIKDCLTIVDRLSKIDSDDLDVEELEKLIKKSKNLTRSRFWKLW